MKKTEQGEFTPMIRQYLEIKEKYKDYILFYRLGDFYEMFFEDAELASKELELVLTGRDCGQDEKAPMCGVPYHSCEAYIARLIARGYNVAICEQTEDPKQAKGLVRREVVRMITPGTVIESSMLDESKNNYICGVYLAENEAGVCFSDISTGEMYASGLSGKEIVRKILNEIGRFSPAEAVLNETAAKNKDIIRFLSERMRAKVVYLPEEQFERADCESRAKAQFALSDLVSAGIAEGPAVLAVGGLLQYLHETQKNDLSHLRVLNVYREGQFMELDLSARTSLEMLETMRTREKKGSLLWVLDKTKTAMGGRLLRQWIEKPLIDVSLIKKRQGACAELMANVVMRTEVAAALAEMFDMERLIGRIVYGTANCKDLRTLAETARRIPTLKKLIEPCRSSYMNELHLCMDELPDLVELIDRAVVDEPPFSVREGGFIRSGYDDRVDELKELVSGGKGLIGRIETTEREKTGIKGLKVGYNRVFGYYIEVTRSNFSLVPNTYIRKQTLANCERYITEELKQLEAQVLTASERLQGLEYELFGKLRETIASEVHRVQRTGHAVAALDVLVSLASVGSAYSYCMPDVDYSDKIDIKDGRHPVVERMEKDGLFVPNDTQMDCTDNRMLIITGPNMAGKSTYMRQVALIVILAQMGAPVPARAARIGVCDRVFTRIGASDDLTAGQSTFMIEMQEVADILRFATVKSLLILDEIGRGTSTFDGMAIARAVLEYAVDRKKLGAKTLFATHYHELTALETMLDGVKNYNIAVKKRGDDITFLRKIVRGGADDSYGIEVAKLAGIPQKVINRAKVVLAGIEEQGGGALAREKEVWLTENESAPDEQVSLADMSASELVFDLKTLDVNTLTPIEAMNLLYQFKNRADRL